MIYLSSIEPNVCYYVFMQKWSDGWTLTDGRGGVDSITFADDDYSEFYLCTSVEEANKRFSRLHNQHASYIVPVMLLDSGEWV